MLNRMARAKLINQICPTNATYNCYKDNYEEDCSNCTRILHNLLNEYDEYVKETAINDFVAWLEIASSIPKSRVIEEYKEYLEQLNKG